MFVPACPKALALFFLAGAVSPTAAAQDLGPFSAWPDPVLVCRNGTTDLPDALPEHAADGFAPRCYAKQLQDNVFDGDHWRLVNKHVPFVTVHGFVFGGGGCPEDPVCRSTSAPCHRPSVSPEDYCGGHHDRDFELHLLPDAKDRTSVLAPANLCSPEPSHAGSLGVESEWLYLFPMDAREGHDSSKALSDPAFAMTEGRLALPKLGDEIAVRGSLIWDCGHPDDAGCGFRSELHPVVAMAWVETRGTGVWRVHVKALTRETSKMSFSRPFDGFRSAFDFPGAGRLVWSNANEHYALRIDTIVNGCPDDSRPSWLKWALPALGRQPWAYITKKSHVAAKGVSNAATSYVGPFAFRMAAADSGAEVSVVQVGDPDYQGRVITAGVDFDVCRCDGENAPRGCEASCTTPSLLERGKAFLDNLVH